MVELRIHGDDGHADRVDAPEDLSALELLREFLHARGRPYSDAQGHPLPWKLEDRQTGTVLQLDKTLEQNGIRSGQELTLVLVRGTPSDESMLCEKCNRENCGGAPVCSHCGTVCSHCGAALLRTSDLKLEGAAPDGKSHHAVRRSDSRTQEFLTDLVKIFGLPSTDKWELFDAKTNRTLDSHKTLIENGIVSGQRLALRRPDERPGEGHPKQGVRCEKCKSDNLAGAAFCRHCGAALGKTSDLKLEVGAPDGKSHHAVLPPDTLTQEFLAELGEVFGLPSTDKWELFDANTNRTLDSHKTLIENGIVSGQRLALRSQDERRGEGYPKQGVRCEKCKSDNLAGAAFCSHCGAALGKTSDLKLEVGAPDGKSHHAVLPPDTRTQEFLAELVEVFGLPRTEDWELFDADANRTLDAHKTLAENGVESGHRLRLQKKRIEPPINIWNVVRREWKRIAVVLALIALVAWAINMATPAVVVSIEPTGPLKLSPSQSQTFSVIVQHGRTKAVKWSLDPALGSVSTDGVYTAPASVLSTQTVKVIAESQDDPHKTATASITLVPPPIRIDPPTMTLGPNQSAQFSVEPAEFSVEQAEELETAVDWSLDPAVGTITPLGVYTAPPDIPAPQTVTLIATSKTDPANSARATISLTQSQTAQLTISPKRVSLGSSQSRQFTATLTPNAGGAILWSVDPAIGNVSQQGLYNAPGFISAGRQVRVAAKLSTDSNIAAVATVILQPVALSPISATVNGTQVQLHATVMHGSNTGITWSINPQVGNISPQGIYTPPSPISVEMDITATATSQDDPTKSSNFIIHLKPKVAITKPKVAITLNPYRSVLTNSQQQMLSASVTGTQDNSVTWAITGPGTLLPSGLYTAPATIPPGGQTVLIVVTSHADPNQRATGDFRLVPNTVPPKRVKVSQGVTQGLLIHEVKPEYPALARSAGVQGTVVLQALITKDGAVQNLKVISGPPMLTNSALQAVSQWKYNPYRLDGEAVEAETTINVIFTLQR